MHVTHDRASSGSDDRSAGYDPALDVHRGHPVGMTRTEVDHPPEGLNVEEVEGTPQQDLTADDLRGDAEG